MESNSGLDLHPPPVSGKKEKRFQCQTCQRMFARLEHLQRHERIRNGVKPFSCVECNYSFTRSDLLVRHERLTHHKDNSLRDSPNVPTNNVLMDLPPHKRIRTSIDVGRPASVVPSFLSPPTPTHVNVLPPIRPRPPIVAHPATRGDSYSLTALSMAAEYHPLQQMSDAAISHRQPLELLNPLSGTSDPNGNPGRPFELQQPPESPIQHQNQSSTLADSLDGLTAFLDNVPLSSYHFASLINTEQPMPFFSPESFTCGAEDTAQGDIHSSLNAPTEGQAEDPHSFSRFGSRLPSLQPEEGRSKRPTYRTLADISFDDRQALLDKLTAVSDAVPPGFKLPSRLALCRYIAAYINGFHEHMPFLHIPTMSVENCSIELILAMAAVGAQYTFEGEIGVELFNASRSIATYRIRMRDARVVERHDLAESERSSPREGDSTNTTRGSRRASSTIGLLGLPSDSGNQSEGDDLMQTAQALLLLMALCTWAKHKEILREALAIQSVLATLIRDDGLQDEPLKDDPTWSAWVKRETNKRTKFIVFGFSNLHCIVYNIPPFLLTSEVKLTLPSTAAEFKATTEAAWKEAKKNSAPEVLFQDALQRLFSKDGRDITERNSSSGNYALIHALIQHIFFVRQVARGRFDGTGEISSDDVASLETALRNWQIGWRRNPESSLDPVSPNGPVAFNSTALLRLAYIRLYVDTAGRALDTRDPLIIANALRDGPSIKRSPKITRAVLHSAHALSIPIKIGYRLVAKTQSFVWSIQHSLCTLECAYLLSKWLDALSTPDPEPPISEDESGIVSIVKNMLDETEFALSRDLIPGTPPFMKALSAGVLRVWATIFKGSQTWAIVDVIGCALNVYADMLEPS